MNVCYAHLRHRDSTTPKLNGESWPRGGSLSVRLDLITSVCVRKNGLNRALGGYAYFQAM